MKLTELEDYDKLQNALERIQISIDKLENKLDSRINRVERTVWLAVAASVAQIVTVLFHR